MKRLPLILFILANSILLFAQSSMSDLYKLWMIEDINNGNFEKAAEEILRVDDWRFDDSDQKDYLFFNKAMGFVLYIDSVEIPRMIIDSFQIYLTKQLSFLGFYFVRGSDYQKAEDCLLQSLEIRRKVLGEQHPVVIEALIDLGILYENTSDYQKAEDYYLQSLEIQRKVLGEQHRDYAAILNALGLLYHRMGNYQKAEAYSIQATEILKNVIGEQHPDYALSLNALGALYRDIGIYRKAEAYLIQASEILKNVLEEQYSYSNTLGVLGSVYFHMGDYQKAEDYYLQSLEIERKVLGEQHPDYASSLGSLGSLYSEIGDYQKAEDYYLRALETRKNVLGEQHPAYASSLNNLGILYSKMGDYQKAEMYILRALEISKNILGEQHPDYASSLNNLGYLYYYMGDYQKAEDYYLQSLEIRRKVLGEQHPDYASSLNNLGALYREVSMYQKAEEYLLNALEIQKNVLGEQHPGNAPLLMNLGLVYSKEGNYIKAETYLQEMYSLLKSTYVLSMTYMTEQQRQYFWEAQEPYMLQYRGFLYKYQLLNPSVSSEVYDNELFTKGLLLTSSDAVSRSILESKDSTLIADFQELTSLRQRVMTLQEKDPQSQYIKQYQQQADSLEKVLTINSAIFRESQEIWDITRDSVRNHLTGTDVAVEYMDVPLAGDSTMYCALLLRDTCSYPIMIPLFEEKEVQPLANAKTKGEFAPDKVYDYAANGKELTAKIWSKIMPYIKPGETVYFAPSGLLHQLAIEALPYDSTHTMADVYNMVRLSSTREIVMHKNDNHYTTATLYGGIQYDVNADTLLAESRRYAQDQLLASRGIEDDTLDRGNIKYLAWTKTEVEDISDLLQKNKLQVHLFTSTSANEESFKALSGKHQNILHIATHGFFWTDSTAQKKDYFTQRMMPFGNDRPAPPSIDPLNRCGLLFAGAQTAWSGHSADLTEGVQDGILTAKEISLLDLRDADLVVLSACETGKGEITSDGVFGLQRAFKQAGAQTIIMSLWPVNDASTQLLMTEFYRNWITYHQSKREAFRNAQNTVRAKYEEPYYWAGFIMLD